MWRPHPSGIACCACRSRKRTLPSKARTSAEVSMALWTQPVWAKCSRTCRQNRTHSRRMATDGASDSKDATTVARVLLARLWDAELGLSDGCGSFPLGQGDLRDVAKLT